MCIIYEMMTVQYLHYLKAPFYKNRPNVNKLQLTTHHFRKQQLKSSK